MQRGGEVKMSNKNGSSFFVLNKDEHDSSSEEEENANRLMSTEHKYDLEAIAEHEEESLDDKEENMGNDNYNDDIM